MGNIIGTQRCGLHAGVVSSSQVGCRVYQTHTGNEASSVFQGMLIGDVGNIVKNMLGTYVYQKHLLMP